MNNLEYFAKGVYVHAKTFKKRRENAPGFDKKKILYLFRVLSHPLDIFNDLKFEHKESIWIANFMAFLYFAVSLLTSNYTGYLFNPNYGKTVNMLLVLARTVGVLIFWSVCNWATCTLMDGEGSIKDIWIMMTYSLLPYIILAFIALILSQMFSQSEAAIYSTIQLIGKCWTLILIFLGMLTAHQYTVARTIGSIICTILIMFAACFLAMIFFAIAQQMYSFISSVLTELLLR